MGEFKSFISFISYSVLGCSISILQIRKLRPEIKYLDRTMQLLVDIGLDSRFSGRALKCSYLQFISEVVNRLGRNNLHSVRHFKMKHKSHHSKGFM